MDASVPAREAFERIGASSRTEGGLGRPSPSSSWPAVEGSVRQRCRDSVPDSATVEMTGHAATHSAAASDLACLLGSPRRAEAARATSELIAAPSSSTIPLKYSQSISKITPAMEPYVAL
jgi:hypothetical protein